MIRDPAFYESEAEAIRGAIALTFNTAILLGAVLAVLTYQRAWFIRATYLFVAAEAIALLFNYLGLAVCGLIVHRKIRDAYRKDLDSVVDRINRLQNSMIGSVIFSSRVCVLFSILSLGMFLVYYVGLSPVTEVYLPDYVKATGAAAIVFGFFTFVWSLSAFRLRASLTVRFHRFIEQKKSGAATWLSNKKSHDTEEDQ